MSKEKKKCIAPECEKMGQGLGKGRFSTRCRRHRKGEHRFVTLEGRVMATLGKKKKNIAGSKTFKQGINSLKDSSPQFYRP
jgi:hypothetical protein